MSQRTSSEPGASAATDAPLNKGEQAELELRNHFVGRRDGKRVSVSLEVELVCLERNVAAMAVLAYGLAEAEGTLPRLEPEAK